MECDGNEGEKNELQSKGTWDYHLSIEHRRRKQEKEQRQAKKPVIDYGRRNQRRNR